MTIDEYILSQPENLQETLWAVRNTIATTLPNAQERISYGMPTFYNGAINLDQGF